MQRDDYLFVNVDRLILINFFAYPIDLIIAIVILGASGCDDVNYSPIYQFAGLLGNFKNFKLEFDHTERPETG